MRLRPSNRPLENARQYPILPNTTGCASLLYRCNRLLSSLPVGRSKSRSKQPAVGSINATISRPSSDVVLRRHSIDACHLPPPPPSSSAVTNKTKHRIHRPKPERPKIFRQHPPHPSCSSPAFLPPSLRPPHSALGHVRHVLRAAQGCVVASRQREAFVEIQRISRSRPQDPENERLEVWLTHPILEPNRQDMMAGRLRRCIEGGSGSAAEERLEARALEVVVHLV